jgi:hypothetical protein
VRTPCCHTSAPCTLWELTSIDEESEVSVLPALQKLIVGRLREPKDLKSVHTWLAERKRYSKHFKLFDRSIAVQELAGDFSSDLDVVIRGLTDSDVDLSF